VLTSPCSSLSPCVCAGHFVGVLDYIFYSKAHLSVMGCLDVDHESALKQHTALPNPQFASDHISLLAELDWLDA
jgi:mRNA deadenylase 3'-5' endonuclease subunit Ccr4